jgi:outer membrane receptor protein involved in Fe transport
VVATNVNLSTWKTSGVDVNANYNLPIGDYGSLGFNMVGTWLDSLEFEDIPGLGVYDCTGLYGFVCGDPNAEWRHKLRMTWFSPWNFDVSLAWRFYDSVEVDASDSNPLLASDFEPIDKELDAQNYIDIAGSWTIFENYTLRLGINNITDEDPPITGTTDPSFNGNGNTFPNTYDSLGRYVFMGLSAKF